MDQEKFKIFIDNAGLRQCFICTLCDIPEGVMCDWKRYKGRLSRKQLNALQAFVENYCRNNSFMRGVECL